MISRRSLIVLSGIGVGLGVSLLEDSRAFTALTGQRGASIEIASEGDGIVGILPQDTVQYRQRDPLVEYQNNYAGTIDVTTSLSDSSDGVLYDNNGNSGDTLTITLVEDGGQFIEIKAAETGTISYAISVSAPNFSLSSAADTDAVTGYNAGAVDIRRPNKDKDFSANISANRWEITTIDVRDNDGDNDLDHLEIAIREGGSFGTAVATKTIDIKQKDSDRYAPSGNPDARIKPDEKAYVITAGTTYALEFRAYDVDGNYAVESLETTA